MALTLIALRMRPESERSECELETDDTRNNTAYIYLLQGNFHPRQMIFISYRIRDSSRIFQIFPSSKLQKQQVRGVCSAPWLAGQVVAVGNTGASGWRHSEGTLLAPHSGNIPLGKDLDGRKLCIKLLD